MARLNVSGNIEHGSKIIEVQLNVYSFKEDESYIAYCPALDLSSYGTTESNARMSFEEILSITLKYMINKNTLIEDLQKHGWNIKSLKQKKIKSPSIEQMIHGNKVLRDILDNKEYRKYNQQVKIAELQ
jgi:hypothetical protein